MDISEDPAKRPAGHQTRAEPTLEVLAIGAAEERVYYRLLAEPSGTLAQLADATGLRPAQLRPLLDSLETRGLASRSATRPVRFTPAPPDVALEVLIRQRERDLEQIRRTATALAAQMRATRHATPSGAEVITGRQAITQRVIALQQTATTEIMMIDKPPYVGSTGQDAIALELDSLRRGVTWRGLYDTSAVQHPGILEATRHLAAAGEHCRVLDGLPLKLIIADRQQAILPMEQPVESETMLLHASPLLDALIMLFDTLWQRATPLWPATRTRRPPATDDTTPPLDQRLLALLAAGLTDQAIARQLDIGQRTIERHISRIMTELGAKTRFQAGVQAGLHGWLTHTEPPPKPAQTTRQRPAKRAQQS